MAMTINGTGTITGLSVGGLPVGTVNSATILDGAVAPVDTQVGALPSMVWLINFNGWGSTNTAIRRFLTTQINQGTDITYADSATLGSSFTINTNGVYAISYSDIFSTNNFAGISLNSNQLTTPVAGITQSNIVAIGSSAAANANINCQTTMYLPAGSVIRAHSSAGLTNGTNASSLIFTITRVA